MSRKLKTTEEYSQELLDLGLDFYCTEEYSGALIPINHECLNGHSWKMEPNSALKGNACPECTKSGLQRVRLYHISFMHENQKYYKIGISNQFNLRRRFREKYDKLSIEPLWELEYPNRFIARAHELLLIHRNLDYRVNLGVFGNRGGDTETISREIEKPVYLE